METKKNDFFVKDIEGWENWFSFAPRTFEHFALWISEFFGNKIPWDIKKQEGYEFNEYPLDAMWEAFAEETSFAIWYANRGGGKTFDLSQLSFMESIFKPVCGINVLGGSLDQAQKSISYLTAFWELDNAPKHLLGKNQVAGRGYKLINNSWVKALAASTKSVRGSHQQKLRIDEVDELERKIYEAALGQPTPMNGIPQNIIISSTLHNPFGLMSEIIDEREKTGAKLFPWCVYDVAEPHGWWTKEEIETKKRQTTKEMFEAEYECKRPKVGDSIFDYMMIDRAWRRGFDITFDNEYEFNEAGIDWGYTCTVMHIIQDKKEFINIPNSFSWEYYELTDRCKEIIDICIEKKIKVIYCDSNPKDSTMTLRKVIKKKRAMITVIPIAFSVWKDIAINVIRFYLKTEIVNIKSKEFKKFMQKYHYKNVDLEIIEKKDDHFPDAFIAWAASRWRILGYLTEEEIKKREKQEERNLSKINVGTY